MIIDFLKLIILTLPTRLRNLQIVELFRTLMQQLQVVFFRFTGRLQAWRYRIMSDASILSLKETIRRELEIDATITELSGRPTDFLVEVSGIYDENRLRALIDANKLAGKSYTFRLGETAYTAEFTNHLCENIIAIYTAEFSDYMCEDDMVVYIKLSAHKVSDGIWFIGATASRPVASNVRCMASGVYLNSAGQQVGNAHGDMITIQTGETYAEVQALPNPPVSVVEIVPLGHNFPEPASDATYTYKWKTVN